MSLKENQVFHTAPVVTVSSVTQYKPYRLTAFYKHLQINIKIGSFH